MKVKKCDICGKEGPLWRARTKESPSCCKNCMYSGAVVKEGIKKPNKKSEWKQIAPLSDKKLNELAKYRIERKKFLEGHQFCEIRSPVCIGQPVNIHHTKPRAYHLCDVDVFKAACDPCNSYIESHHDWAREKGFKLDHLGDKK